MNKQSLQQRVIDRIDELETKITFQEESIDALNQVLIGQQKDLHKLKQVIENLHSQMERMGDIGAEKQQDETPPHY